MSAPRQKKTIAIIQARMGSTRLPGKVMAKVDGDYLICKMIDRVRLSNFLDEIWVACTKNPLDDPLEKN